MSEEDKTDDQEINVDDEDNCSETSSYNSRSDLDLEDNNSCCEDSENIIRWDLLVIQTWNC